MAIVPLNECRIPTGMLLPLSVAAPLGAAVLESLALLPQAAVTTANSTAIPTQDRVRLTTMFAPLPEN